MQQIRHCPSCGHTTEQRVPEGDTHQRAVCSSCNTIHYQNPKVVAGTIPVWEDKVLLCRRAINPQHGKWTLPAGFMENGESIPDCAARETWEEAQAEVQNLQLFTVQSIPQFSQIYMIFRAELAGSNRFSPGEESLETILFREQDIPWDELAFKMIHRSLECFFNDRRKGQFGLHVEDIVK